MIDFTKYNQRLAAAQKQELTRQALLRGEATAATLAYARFLSAVANASTISHGQRKAFRPESDAEILREWPCLSPLLEPQE
jgi:hypothetical protein